MVVTYEMIKPYIAEEKLEGSNVKCKFQVDGEIFESNSYIKVDSKSSTHNIKNMARSSVLGRLRGALTNFIYKFTGGGLAGNIATMAASETMRQNVSTTSYSRKDQDAAVVDAFKKIEFNLYYDENNRKFKIARQFSEFEKRLKSAPITKAYDKKTLARMLVEMSKADGQIENEEKAFLEGFLSADTGTLSELSRRAPLSAVECEEVTKELKQSLLMIVAAMAISDHDFEAPERQKLSEFGNMMGLTPEKQAESLKLAQDYTIELLIRGGQELSRDEVYAFADKIGMDRAEAERAQVRYDRRTN
jgi:tellurite resistance protein